jgi:mannose-6-phosphate isomerase-like protein (cupin superfamily)
MAHRTVEEVWYFVSGRGQMWRRSHDHEEIVDVEPGVAITIPVGTHFQFRSLSHEPLTAVGTTMLPWPGESEAVTIDGIWEPTI